MAHTPPKKDPLGRYILDGHTPVPAPDLLDWGLWFEKADRHVAKTEFPDGTLVSTVFLGLDHSFGDGPPLLFETMVFEDPKNPGSESYMDRCSTWDEAVEMHKRAVYLVGEKYLARHAKANSESS